MTRGEWKDALSLAEEILWAARMLTIHPDLTGMELLAAAVGSEVYKLPPRVNPQRLFATTEPRPKLSKIETAQVAKFERLAELAKLKLVLSPAQGSA